MPNTFPPRVALESTLISHGLPFPKNLETARRLEAIIRETGAEPRTVGIIGGEVRVGMEDDEIAHMAQAERVVKVSRRDLPPVLSLKLDGATTVATTMWFARRHGIQVFATGGIGGVHRGSGPPGSGSFDISADLAELARTPMTVVCAGPKAILDLEATREVLETGGVTVVGYQTDSMPAFYSRSSGLPVDVRLDTPEAVARLILARDAEKLPAAILVTVPCPKEAAIPTEVIEPAINTAIREARDFGLRAGELTPFLLKRVSDLTGELSLIANQALLANNARVAGEIACALHELSEA